MSKNKTLEAEIVDLNTEIQLLRRNVNALERFRREDAADTQQEIATLRAELSRIKGEYLGTMEALREKMDDAASNEMTVYVLRTIESSAEIIRSIIEKLKAE